MKIGMVGLGRMGGNMVRRLSAAGHACVAFDFNSAAVTAAQAEGAVGASSLEELVHKLEPPRHVWIMVPAGEPTESTVQRLGELLSSDDVIIDGGNSYFKDDVRRGAALAARNVHYMDVGTSGGIWGAERGYCLMVGGNVAVFHRLEPIFASLAPGRGDVAVTPGRTPGTSELGYLHCGPIGSGHFVKMVHNGIEYGLMQAYAEGFEILESTASKAVAPEYRYDLNLASIAEVWRRGSVVGSWLLDLTAMALSEDQKLAAYAGRVQDSGEGRWALQAAIEEAVPAPVLSAALFTRFRSRKSSSFAEKLLSAMREKFGGHREAKGAS